MNQTKERPILFSAPMVRAILSGRKKVTRRALKVQPHIDVSGNFCVGGANYGQDIYGKPVTKHFVSSHCPYGQPGDRLWVREAWQDDAQVNAIAPRELSHGEPIQYPADGASRQNGCSMITPGKTRPSIHMPRWVSRILLEINDVRVERLQDISEGQAEGVNFLRSAPDLDETLTAAQLFDCLWSSINSADSWNANPWVWVVEFKPVTR
ncbi:hypothetical protein L6218_11900 [Pseudomonas syringae pv. syringae]|uniref:Morphogenetic protein n=2 Tax=Pseudomonas fragariae (ex Marin et al. 2024) TaxID=3080056 RepID=A0ABU5B909_9PSED|nr:MULTISPECIES: hypothetical protein [Pseudomonas]MCW6058011.1 hypothetical protein [Pseudomonas fragi]AVB28538.1 hypothetical protein BKC06_014410 [Pseudomonas syringae pv. syringae]KWS13864.1 hypothetical protein AL063_11750 [Pseudomonas syringae pv. syringae]MCF5184058.1 hypothetical protein [Pseudomonas syringae]MCF5312696.1 hypothetical protein [Pseudomonas syringae]